MKHSAIANVAVLAALEAAAEHDDYRQEEAYVLGPDLYAYLRQRKFPVPETLARAAAAMDRTSFPFPSLDDAPEPVQAYFITFHAVCLALDRFWEADEEKREPADDPIPDPKQESPVQTDSVDARTKAAQAETDKVIAESGGKFGDDGKPSAGDAIEKPAPEPLASGVGGGTSEAEQTKKKK